MLIFQLFQDKVLTELVFIIIDVLIKSEISMKYVT